MANSFNKEERVQFENLLQKFDDSLAATKNVRINKTDQIMMERTGDVIWRPQPYIATSYGGTDQSNNFKDQTQLSVPASITYARSVPWLMSATELRDALQEQRLGDAARQKLASDINFAVLQVACAQGTIVVKTTTAAAGFGDVANIEGYLNRVGVMGWERCLNLSTFTYNGLAKDLANRQNMVEMTKEAYKNGYVGPVASFDTWKLDYSLRIAAAGGGGGITIDQTTAGNNWVPKATKVSSGARSNVDNRYQQVTWSTTASVVAGDCFTIAGCNEVHHIAGYDTANPMNSAGKKLDTGNLKTFRVISVDSGTLVTVSPPIVSGLNSGSILTADQAELQYQNCLIAAPVNNAAIVFLNTAAADINPFWQKDAIELLPGRFAVPSDAGAAVLRGTTSQGIELVMQKQYKIENQKTLYRIDILFGVTMVQPEMAGIAIFSQP